MKTTHQLARELIELPDVPVELVGDLGPDPVATPVVIGQGKGTVIIESRMANDILASADEALRLLEPIAQAADKLEQWLAQNTGPSDDCPVQVSTNSDESADEFAGLLTVLFQALKPYRAEKK